MSLVRTTVHCLALTLALAGMLAGQLAAQCHADADNHEPDFVCMDLCTFTGSAVSLVQLVTAPATGVPCDCIHAVAPKTTTCRIANRPATTYLQAGTAPGLAAPTPPAPCRESLPVGDPPPALSLDILRTTIIQS